MTARRARFAAPLFAALATLAALTVALAACGGGGGDEQPTTTPDDAAAPTPTVAEAPAIADLAQSVVQIVALEADFQPVWTGSGTVITGDGLILTNAHVVDDRLDEYDLLGVAITDRTDQPPEPAFLAEITAVDYALDLAVIRIVTDLDGNAASPSLRPIRLGDSEQVELGDTIRILGFPGIGGETITFTEGAISGFTAQRAVADRAWIKTDATISGGNSGGLAANEAGEIIGVPTIVGSGQGSESIVDCRFVVDTNRDGSVDGSDDCVPVGGFINGLRPIALALPLIDAAQAGQTYVSSFAQESDPAGTFDAEDIDFDSFVFADGVTEDDRPTNVVASLPSGATDVCAFWDYTSMADGVSWEALWFVNGELNNAGSIIDATWVGGESGNWWVCLFNEQGLVDGFYEIVISVEGDNEAADGVFVGGDHEIVAFDLDVQTAVPACFVFLSPSQAENWGNDELGASELIEPGDVRTFPLPAGVYDLLVLDCEAETLAEEYEMDVTVGGTYTLR